MPEFLNRIDDVVVFRPLDRAQIRKIVTLQLAGLSSRLQQNGLSLEVTDAAIDQIADSGYDPTYGARPLKRVIQREIQNPLATSILKAQYDEGTTIRADFNGDRFTFTAT